MLELTTLVLSILLNPLLGLFVLLKNTKSVTHRYFFLSTVGFASYSLINYISLHPFWLSQLTWIRLDLFVAVPLFLFVFLTFDAFPDSEFTGHKWLRRGITIYSLLVMGLCLTPLVFSRLESGPNSVYPVPGPGIALFAIQQLGMLAGTLVVIIRKFKRSTGVVREQFHYIVTGIALTLGLIIVFNLVLVQVFKITSLVPLGSLSTLVFTSAFSYAIIRHRLLNIRAVVARSVTYILLLGTFAFVYSMAIFSISHRLTGGTVSGPEQVVHTLLALILATTFGPLRKFFEHMTDHLFFRDRYDSGRVINDVTKVLASEINLDSLLDKSLALLCRSLRLEYGQFMIYSQGALYKVAHYGRLPYRLMTVPSLNQLDGGSIMIADELGPGERKETMEQHGIRVAVQLKTKEEFVGFLLLGDKLSGDIYSDQDLRVLEILSKELTIAILNARSYQQIASFNVTLQHKVEEATQQLREANENLKALDRTKDEFLSMASHQLRTPLTGIKGYLSMLAEGDAGKISPEQKQFVDYAIGGAERMVGLISDLLNVSRLSAGRFVIQKAPVDVVEMVRDEIRQLQTHADAKGLKLEFTPPPGKHPLVNLDEGKTRQVIMNFIDNAIYYTKRGRVTITLEYDSDAVRLKVRDTGIGVPTAARDKLFSKFFRADNAQSVRPDGTGLGLYLAKRVIEDQGGTIIFESTEGQGSTFGFEMPFHTKVPAKPSPVPEPESIKVGSAK